MISFSNTLISTGGDVPYMDSSNDTTTMQTTATSLTILELVKKQDGARLATLTEQLELTKSTVHAHLMTLCDHGYLVKEGEIYRLGLRLWHLGNQARNGREVFALAQSAVHELATRTQEEAEFDVESTGEIISVFSEMGNNNEPTFEPGRVFHPHNTATGKAILAELPPEERERILTSHKLPVDTAHTVTSRDSLKDELAIIQRQGYALNDEELREGLRAVGAALKYPDGRILGGLSVGGPIYRISDEYFTDDLPKILLEVVNEFQQKLKSTNPYL
jgi:DNA-binding IclR family transcriptional regulator